MKKNIIISILLAATSSVFSQAFKATYSYDAAGNRTTATIIWLTSSLKNDEVIDSAIAAETHDRASLATTDATIPKQGYTQPNLDSMAGTKITIYPNPTYGMLLVQLDGFAVVTQERASLSHQETSTNNMQGGSTKNGNSVANGNSETHNGASQQSIAVYDISGNNILQLSPLSQYNSIDLQSQPAGTYILVLQLGSFSKTYSIIKN